jgi:phenylacetate-coenzyme A ligase PaaK-like adenylate-forming protein
VEKLPFNIPQIFNCKHESEFSSMALDVFRFQYEHNKTYRAYVDLLKVDVQSIDTVEKIPFLPISFFKTHEVKSFDSPSNLIFKSSGTSGMERSTHHILDPTIYQMSFIKGFEEVYGHV